MTFFIGALLLITMTFNIYDGEYKAALIKGILLIFIISMVFIFKKLGEVTRKEFPDMEKNTDKK